MIELNPHRGITLRMTIQAQYHTLQSVIWLFTDGPAANRASARSKASGRGVAVLISSLHFRKPRFRSFQK